MSFDSTNPALAPNAAKETSGNLDAMAALLKYMQVLVDLNTKMLAVLTATRLQQASAFNVSIEPSAVAEDNTFN